MSVLPKVVWIESIKSTCYIVKSLYDVFRLSACNGLYWLLRLQPPVVIETGQITQWLDDDGLQCAAMLHITDV